MRLLPDLEWDQESGEKAGVKLLPSLGGQVWYGKATCGNPETGGFGTGTPQVWSLTQALFL